MLPTSVVHPIRPVDVPVNSPYFGYGSSNQCYRNSIQAMNLGPGQDQPKLQSDLYIPDVNAQVVDLQAQITTIEGDLAYAALAVGPVGTSSNSAAAVITTQTLHLQPADATNPGVITTGAQTISGAKTFTGVLAASNLSGTNTGDLTLATIGSSPNANGASIIGQVLTLQPADAYNGGVVTNTTQSIAGDKTLTGNLTCNKGIHFQPAAAGNKYVITATNPTADRSYAIFDLSTDGSLTVEETIDHVSDYTNNAGDTTYLTAYSHRVTRKNNQVTITFPSNSSAFTGASTQVKSATALASRFRPVTAAQSFPARIQAGGTAQFGYIEVSTAGVITWYRNAFQGAWAGTANDAFFATSITYNIV